VCGIGVIKQEGEKFESLLDRFQKGIGKRGCQSKNSHWNDVLKKSHLARWGKKRGVNF